VLAAALFTVQTLAPRADDDDPEAPPPEVQNDAGSGSQGDRDVLLDGGSDKPDESVGAILARHPDRDIVICLAGCGPGSGPRLVAINRPVRVSADDSSAAPAKPDRPVSRPVGSAPAGRGAMAPTSATTGAQSADTTSAGQMSSGQASPPDVGDVVCLAGCIGEPGQVVLSSVRLTWLPASGDPLVAKALGDIAAAAPLKGAFTR